MIAGKRTSLSRDHELLSRDLEITNFVTRDLEITNFVTRDLEITNFVTRDLEITNSNKVLWETKGTNGLPYNHNVPAFVFFLSSWLMYVSKVRRLHKYLTCNCQQLFFLIQVRLVIEQQFIRKVTNMTYQITVTLQF